MNLFWDCFGYNQFLAFRWFIFLFLYMLCLALHACTCLCMCICVMPFSKLILNSCWTCIRPSCFPYPLWFFYLKTFSWASKCISVLELLIKDEVESGNWMNLNGDLNVAININIMVSFIFITMVLVICSWAPIGCQGICLTFLFFLINTPFSLVLVYLDCFFTLQMA